MTPTCHRQDVTGLGLYDDHRALEALAGLKAVDVSVAALQSSQASFQGCFRSFLDLCVQRRVYGQSQAGQGFR